MSKGKHGKSQKTKAKSSSPDTLAKANKKASATLNEDELKKVSGGIAKIDWGDGAKL